MNSTCMPLYRYRKSLSWYVRTQVSVSVLHIQCGLGTCKMKDLLVPISVLILYQVSISIHYLKYQVSYYHRRLVVLAQCRRWSYDSSKVYTSTVLFYITVYTFPNVLYLYSTSTVPVRTCRLAVRSAYNA